MSLDLDRIKAAMNSTGIFSDGLGFKADMFADEWRPESAAAMAEVLNAAPSLIAEVERLRQELATATAVGSAEWHEAECKRLEALIEEMKHMGFDMHERNALRRKAQDHAEIAAEIRKGIK